MSISNRVPSLGRAEKGSFRIFLYFFGGLKRMLTRRGKRRFGGFLSPAPKSEQRLKRGRSVILAIESFTMAYFMRHRFILEDIEFL